MQSSLAISVCCSKVSVSGVSHTELSIKGWLRSCYLLSVLFGPAGKWHIHSSARKRQVQLGMRRALGVLVFLKMEAELLCTCRGAARFLFL